MTDHEQNSPKRSRLNENEPEEGECLDETQSIHSNLSEGSIKSSIGCRPPFTNSHKIIRDPRKYHLLIGVTGSVAVIKLKEIIGKLHEYCPKDKLFIKIVATQSAVRMLETQDFEIEETTYEDRDEWSMWRQRGDQVLHIELRKWADAMLIAPLDANSMAKIVHGLCDNLMTSVIRAWDPTKPLYYAPAMNTMMWESPLTYQQRKAMQEFLGFKEIPPVEKKLMCGDTGVGAMASPQMMATIIGQMVKNRFAVYTEVSDPGQVEF